MLPMIGSVLHPYNIHIGEPANFVILLDWKIVSWLILHLISDTVFPVQVKIAATVLLSNLQHLIIDLASHPHFRM